MLAQCINASCTEGALLLWEYYDVHEVDTISVQKRVSAWLLPAEAMDEQNFGLNPLPRYYIVKANPHITSYVDMPAYSGPLNRFEILVSESQLKAACHRIKERSRYTSGDYKK